MGSSNFAVWCHVIVPHHSCLSWKQESFVRLFSMCLCPLFVRKDKPTSVYHITTVLILRPWLLSAVFLTFVGPFIDCTFFYWSNFYNTILKLSATYNRVLLSAFWAISIFGSGWNMSWGNYSPVECFSDLWAELSFPPTHPCLPACLSEWPCRICMVAKVITASSLYHRFITPCCFIWRVEGSGSKTARSHF